MPSAPGSPSRSHSRSAALFDGATRQWKNIGNLLEVSKKYLPEGDQRKIEDDTKRKAMGARATLEKERSVTPAGTDPDADLAAERLFSVLGDVAGS